MKMNLLSKQVSNLKRHLKSLEEEYEQLFGYRPSHADKLNQKEMRKCLLQLTKAKRELKGESYFGLGFIFKLCEVRRN